MSDTQPSSVWQKQLRSSFAFATAVLIVGCLYWARSVLIPLTLAILFTFLLSPPMTFLQRRGLSRIPAAVCVVLATVLFLSGIGWLISSQMTSLASQLPHYQENVAKRIASIREQSADSFIGKVNRFLTRMNQEVTKPKPGDENLTQESAAVSPQPVQIVESESAWSPFTYFAMLGTTLEPLTAVGLVFVFVVFMLIDRDDIRNRIFTLIGHGKLTITTKAIDEATLRISRYLSAQFAINIGYGIVVATGLLCFGVPYAMVWGFFATCFRYVPLVGPWIAMTFPLTISLLASEGWLQPIAIISLFIACELMANLIFDPWLFGKSIGVSQTALMVAIAFWTWLWGAPGLIMAAPLTVCLIVLGKYVPQLKLFDIILGDEPCMTPDLHFYQRLLVKDRIDASEIIAEHQKKLTWEQICDTIFIPTIVHSRRDYAADLLNESDADYILQATQETFTESFEKANPSELPVTENAVSTVKSRILLCAARDQADEAAITIFKDLWSDDSTDLEVVNTNRLVSEVVSQVELESPAMVCIVSLPPGGLAHIRLLCKRLRSRFPNLKIIVGRWGVVADVEENRQQILASGADEVATNMEQTRNKLLLMQKYLSPPSPSAIDKSRPIQSLVPQLSS